MNATYDKMAGDYDTTRRADPRILNSLIGLLELAGNADYLDVACGTGNYSLGLAQAGGRWQAFDHSETMLQEARPKSSQVSWQQMDVAEIHFPEAEFDGVVCTLAIHNFPDLAKAFAEISRVLKPHGKFVLFSAFPSQMEGYWLCEYFPEMMSNACAQMPSEATVMDCLAGAGLERTSTVGFDIDPALQDFFLYSGKQRPHMYLIDDVRNGISSFRNGFCPDQELNCGLGRLKADIDSGQVWRVIDSYENDGGDYIFVQSTKRR